MNGWMAYELCPFTVFQLYQDDVVVVLLFYVHGTHLRSCGMMLKDAYGWHSQGRLKLASISVQTDHSLPSLPKCRVKSEIYFSPLRWKIFILSRSCTG